MGAGSRPAPTSYPDPRCCSKHGRLRAGSPQSQDLLMAGGDRLAELTDDTLGTF